MFVGLWVFRARQILAPGGRLLNDGAVWGRGERIAGAGLWRDVEGQLRRFRHPVIREFPEALLAPGFLNAHCHLELSFLRGAIPPGLPFARWLETLAFARRGVSQAAAEQAAREAAAELAGGGCAFTAEISGLEYALPALSEKPLGMEARVYFEVIDFDPASGPERVRQRARLARESAKSGIQPGLSPHAPYTVTPELLREAARVSARARLPLCLHLAESREEWDMWTRGEGALLEFFRRHNFLAPGWRAPGVSPAEWLDSTGILPPRGARGAPVLLAHVNEVTENDLERLAARHVAAVVCPRTHLYFQRGAFPLERLRRAGIPTALGTDGLSSNPGLSLWEELRAAARLCPRMAFAELLELVTAESARALGAEARYGALCPGRRAAFTLIHSPASAPPPHDTAARDWLLDLETIPLPLLTAPPGAVERDPPSAGGEKASR